MGPRFAAHEGNKQKRCLWKISDISGPVVECPDELAGIYKVRWSESGKKREGKIGE